MTTHALAQVRAVWRNHIRSKNYRRRLIRFRQACTYWRGRHCRDKCKEPPSSMGLRTACPCRAVSVSCRSASSSAAKCRSRCRHCCRRPAATSPSASPSTACCCRPCCASCDIRRTVGSHSNRHLVGKPMVWRPYRKKDIDILERVQRRATKMIQKLRNISYEMRLKNVD